MDLNREAPQARLTRLRSFAIRYINPVTRRIAGWMPGFALLTYTGRKSGRTYRTPINVFRRGDEYVFALTYGSGSQWVKNVLAAGGCEMRRMGRDINLVDPEVIIDPSGKLVPQPIRWFLTHVGRVSEFVRMRNAGEPGLETRMDARS
jgi:deazaflavin-dependent oxidoreductase (nitroreductase family)